MYKWLRVVLCLYLYKIWFIGDEFCNNTFHTLAENKNQNGTHASYVYTNFEVRDFFSSRFSSNDDNVLNRIRSNFVRALNKHNTLPKLIVIVLDDDISKITKHMEDPAMTSLHPISWLMCEFHKLLDIYKDWLPPRAKIAYLPHILWMAPPTHTCFSRRDNLHREAFA